MIFMWQQRDLSLTGKVLIIKALAMSQILYLANLLPFPDDKIKQVEDILYGFIWNGKTHKVKKKIFIQSYEDGGYKMPDIRSVIHAQKLKWVKLYLNNHDCLWRVTMEELMYRIEPKVMALPQIGADREAGGPYLGSSHNRRLSSDIVYNC